MMFLKAFVVGGLICVVGQILIDTTNLTPARILVSFVVLGVLLGALGIYAPFSEWAGAGANVPLTGFGNLLAQAMALGDIQTMDELRAVVCRSEAVHTYEPHHTPEWEAAYQKMRTFL